jgi:hypothetical protein
MKYMPAWLGEHGLACRRVAEPGAATVALMCEVPGGRPGPRFVLEACLDTAPFGDEKWSGSLICACSAGGVPRAIAAMPIAMKARNCGTVARHGMRRTG